MSNWFQSLLPKQGRFFELFEAHAAIVQSGANALAGLLGGNGAIADRIAEIVDLEHDADNVTRDVLQDVRRIFVTPFDRSAITDLVGKMDDSIDEMNKTASAIDLYEVTSFEPQMRDMAAVIVEASGVIVEAMPLLRNVGRNAARLHELTGRLIALEGQADEMHAAGLKAIYRGRGANNTIDFVVGREIFNHLERIVDRFEDVANEIQGLVIDHA
jgi:predicted phosphate transport protein (TIGR00153 family)